MNAGREPCECEGLKLDCQGSRLKTEKKKKHTENFMQSDV